MSDVRFHLSLGIHEGDTPEDMPFAIASTMVSIGGGPYKATGESVTIHFEWPEYTTLATAENFACTAVRTLARVFEDFYYKAVAEGTLHTRQSFIDAAIAARKAESGE